MTMATISIPRHIKGERVWNALMQARPGGLSTSELATVCDLSQSQVRAGLTEIREERAQAERTPLTWSRRTGHQLSEHPEVWREFELSVVHSILTRVIRLLKATVVPHSELVPDDTKIAKVIAQLNAAVASLEMITDMSTTEPKPTRRRRKAEVRS
ncbi:hypothetical protein C5E45_16350 [Nocardia nova]|uniref:RacP protein n=1 Tax=Nocardia nova TaxID=37330 RepID=A0A2S6APS6_9NOCA|nr:hypothetical protein [Nocardia nova]PPJ27828.1 hypothetical protein C5E41_14490 [Nocardia nova]PPJ37220.1 hypothetical protein C5E45_16350 [Nocardia nova]